jgi:hypothetical protein
MKTAALVVACCLFSGAIGCEMRDAELSEESPEAPIDSTGGGQIAIANSSPPEPYVDRGVCPFECCTYTDWWATSQVRVFAAERDTSRVAFSLAPRERFTALTGNVHLTPVGIAVTTDTITLSAGDQSRQVRLEPGDTVYVLSPLGEGTFNFWYRGERYVGEGFWTMMPLSRREAAGRLVREPASQWWAQVRNAAGQIGWINMTADGAKIWGTDRCAGPRPSGLS